MTKLKRVTRGRIFRLTSWLAQSEEHLFLLRYRVSDGHFWSSYFHPTNTMQHRKPLFSVMQTPDWLVSRNFANTWLSSAFCKQYIRKKSGH